MFQKVNWGSFRPGRPGTKPPAPSKSGGRAGSKRPKKAEPKKKGAAGGGGGGGSPGTNDSFMNFAFITAAYLAWTLMSERYSDAGGRVDRIDFQTFRNEVLARDIVDKVRAHKTPWTKKRAPPLVSSRPFAPHSGCAIHLHCYRLCCARRL